MPRRITLLFFLPLLFLLFFSGSIHAQASAKVIRKLNQDPVIATTDANKSYRILFDAYLDLSPPPMTVGDAFNLTTIHAKMNGWAAVSGWGEANPHMAEAIHESKMKLVFGLPYGDDNLSKNDRDAGLYAIIGGVEQREHDFAYLQAIDTMAAWATAEAYRRFEAKQSDEAIELAVDMLYILRQCCDRIFLEEKNHHIELLADALSVFRDMMYVYRDSISIEVLQRITKSEAPLLRPGRRKLLMPEGDRVVAEALLRSVFDERLGGADPEKFAATFSSIQSQQAPLTRFGAARRWEMIALEHGSLDASLERMELIYDDWWRRWRIQEYDPLLDLETEFERTNPVRYAAVIHGTRNLGEIFNLRMRLIMEVNATAVAAALAHYHNSLGTDPNNKEKVYGSPLRKSSDVDPYDTEWAGLQFKRVSSRTAVDTGVGRIWIPRGTGMLWSVGQNHEDDGCEEHTDDGVRGDILIWPPPRALAREQDLIE